MDLKRKTYYIQRTDLVKDYLKDITKYPVLTRKQEEDLFKAYHDLEGNEEAQNLIREKIIMANQRFVFAIAKRYATDDTLIDLVNEGNLGMMAAFNDYDPKLGYRFTTMAGNYIRRAINNYLNKEHLMVRPTNNTLFGPKVKNIERDYVAKYGVKPTIQEIKDALKDKYGVEVKNDSDIYGAYVMSIDDIPAEEDDDIQDYTEYAIVSASHNNYMDTIETEDLSYQMQQALSSLSEREQTIVKMSNGIGYTKEYKDKEIAEELGLSTERVRQLKHSSIEKMQAMLARA